MSRIFEVPPRSLVRYQQVPIHSFESGHGWDSKPALSGLELVHKPAVIIVVTNPEEYKKSKDEHIYITDRFILQSFVENRIEKVQILETFGESAISFFDERTKTYQMAGTFIEAGGGKVNYYKWASEFRNFYDNYLRGTQLAKNKKIAILSVLDNIIYGYPINLVIQAVSTAPYSCTFSMTMIVTKHTTSLKNLESLYTISDIAGWLGIPDVKKELGDKEKVLFELPITKDISIRAMAYGDVEGLVAKLEYLYTKYSELYNRFSKVGERGTTNQTELKTAMLNEIENVKDEAIRIQTVRKLAARQYYEEHGGPE